MSSDGEELNQADRVKALEHVLVTSRLTFEYYESNARQVEEKSRNNLSLGSVIIGVGAIIVKTDEIIKSLRKIQETNAITGLQTTIYSPSIVTYITISPLLIAVILLITLSYFHFLVQGSRNYQMIEPADLKRFKESILKNTDTKLLLNVISGLINSYITSAKSAEEAFDYKSIQLKRQKKLLFWIIFFMVIYIFLVVIIFSVIPVEK
jgi:hypothetical protein